MILSSNDSLPHTLITLCTCSIEDHPLALCYPSSVGFSVPFSTQRVQAAKKKSHPQPWKKYSISMQTEILLHSRPLTQVQVPLNTWNSTSRLEFGFKIKGRNAMFKEENVSPAWKQLHTCPMHIIGHILNRLNLYQLRNFSEVLSILRVAVEAVNVPLYPHSHLLPLI